MRFVPVALVGVCVACTLDFAEPVEGSRPEAVVPVPHTHLQLSLENHGVSGDTVRLRAFLRIFADSLGIFGSVTNDTLIAAGTVLLPDSLSEPPHLFRYEGFVRAASGASAVHLVLPVIEGAREAPKDIMLPLAATSDVSQILLVRGDDLVLPVELGRIPAEMLQFPDRASMSVNLFVPGTSYHVGLSKRPSVGGPWIIPAEWLADVPADSVMVRFFASDQLVAGVSTVEDFVDPRERSYVVHVQRRASIEWTVLLTDSTTVVN